MFKSKYFIICLGMVVLSGIILFSMGRVPWCECGAWWQLWSGQVLSSHNSQHLTDPYTFSHIIHGLIFYALLWMVGRRYSAGRRLVVATFLEVGWEILENTNMVIERYRAATMSLNYFGDSVLNSTGDILAMIFGFWLATKLPIRYSIVFIIAVELILAWWIRDNLTLNIIMLIHPIESIKIWQAGLGV